MAIAGGVAFWWLLYLFEWLVKKHREKKRLLEAAKRMELMSAIEKMIDDKIRENAEEIYRAITENNEKVYKDLNVTIEQINAINTRNSERIAVNSIETSLLKRLEKRIDKLENELKK
jgi:putative lipase involved disintegration of autophagic bodies